MNVALANSILVNVLMRAPEPLCLCALRQLYFDVDVCEFFGTVCDLEIAELLDSPDSAISLVGEGDYSAALVGALLNVSLTPKGKAHLVHILATEMLARTGDDLGDVSDHLFRVIPGPEYFAGQEVA